MKKRMNLVALATVLVFGGLFMSSNEVHAQEHFRYDIPYDLPRNTYVEGLGYFLGHNDYGMGIFSDRYTSGSFVIDLGDDTPLDIPYSDEEQACQMYVATERWLRETYGNDWSVFDIESLMSTTASFSEDIMADLFRKTGTERSKAFHIYIKLVKMGYSIYDIKVLMGPCGFSEEIMQPLFYSTYIGDK